MLRLNKLQFVVSLLTLVILMCASDQLQPPFALRGKFKRAVVRWQIRR